MKRLLTMLSLVLLGFASMSCYDDSALWGSVNDHEQRIKDLEAKVQEVNSSIAAVQALLESSSTGDLIVSVTPLEVDNVEVGYTLTFVSGKTVVIYHGRNGAAGKDGNDSQVPQIGVSAENGSYYWTVNGEWLLDASGSKVPVTGPSAKTPKIKMENEKWYVSYDDGNSWTELVVIFGENQAGSSSSETVTFDDNYVYLNFGSGNTVVIARSKGLDLIFPNGNEISFYPGETFDVEYRIIGGNKDVTLTALSGNGWIASVEPVDSLSGYVHVTAPLDFGPGEVVLLVSDNKETSFIRSILFKDGTLTVSNESFEVGYEAGTIEISVNTDLAYRVFVPYDVDWISVGTPVKSAMREEKITLQIQENTNADYRSSMVYLINNSDIIISAISVFQYGNPNPDREDPLKDVKRLTVAEFLDAEVGSDWYGLLGTITNIVNTTYGNFTLVDDTGSVYVYGLTATKVEKNDKSFSSLDLKEGDMVTIIGQRSSYNGSPQVGGPAYYVPHETK